MLTLLTANGEQHGLIGTLPNCVPPNNFENMAPEHREQKKKEQKEDAKLVKARYINHQYQEMGRLQKPYCRYAGEPIQLYNLIHDYEYTLPLGFIKEVNEQKIPVRADLQALDGKNVNSSGEPTKKDSFRREHELVATTFK